MSLQMQLRRAVIALVIGLALGGVALSSAGADDAFCAQGVGAVIRTVQKDHAGCASSLRIDLAGSVHLTVPCDLSCAPLRSVLNTLHLSATMRQPRCAVTHTA